MKLQDELKERAAYYRMQGPRSEHAALIMEEAAAKIEYLEALLEAEREEAEMYRQLVSS